MNLDQLPPGQAAVVLGVRPPDAAPRWAQWLEDVGFVPGEPVSVLTRAAFGGDPLVVRIGRSTFALRRAEAACVDVRPSER